ncbi:hypothetical protein [Streptomyces sp. NPDC003273]|uniref:hypothetical protein n=1 Tax=Streptomyces sp. NPDC003273 TaxID=3364678 RepID=UPI003682D709
MIRRLISTAAAMAVVLATLTAAAPTAQEHASVTATPKACNTDGAPAQLHTNQAAHLRAGRGTRYRSRAVLAKDTDFYAECWGVTAKGDWWAYGEVISGRYAGFPHGRRGWVNGDLVDTGYRHR